MSEINPQMKRCYYCEQAVKVTVHTCPHCGRSLAELDQQKWERLGPTADIETNGSGGETSFSSERKISLIVGSSCVLAMAVIVAVVVPRLLSNGPKGKIASAPNAPGPEKLSAKQASEGRSFIRIHEDSRPSGEAEAPGKKREQARTEAIRLRSAQIMEQLREEEAVTPYTISLKSGREINCDIISESDARITLRHRGLTTTLEREAVERIEHRPPETVERELKELALARATEMVDDDFRENGQYWVSPEQEERTQSRQSTTTLQTKSDEDGHTKSLNSRTDVEKLESLLSLAREMGVVRADFFGGTLRLEDASGARSGGGSDSESFVAFEAEARQMDLAQVCNFLGLPVQLIGLCNADVEAAFDGGRVATLSGKAEITANEVAIPPLTLDALMLPPNQAAFVAKLSAEKGTLVIEGLLLEGTTYSISGNGTVRLPDKVEESVIESSLSIKFNKAPTVTDTRLGGKGAQYLLETIVASKKAIPVKLSGPVSKPEMLIVYDSEVGPVVWKLGQ
jgi:hypothetical protein